MAQTHKVKIKLVRSRPLTVLVVAVAIVLSIGALILVHTAIADTKAQTQSLQDEAAGLLSERSRLELYMEELGTVQGIIRIAQEKLGLVDPDSIIFQPEE